MKRCLLICLFPLVAALLVGCFADYDTFGESEYRNVEEVRFEEQDGSNATLYKDEHRVVFNLRAQNDSVPKWDSLTFEKINLSHLASLHLVKSKFRNFPSDSVALDSIAYELTYDSKKLQVGDKVRLSSSLKMYFMVVSESGDPALWEFVFNIPGVEAAENSDDGEEPENDISSDSQGESSSSEKMLRSENSLTIAFDDAIDQMVSGDSIYVTFPQGFDLATVNASTFKTSLGATVSPELSSVKDWSKPVTFTVTAENGDDKNWVVVLRTVKNTQTDFSIEFVDQEGIEVKDDTLIIYLTSSSSLAGASVADFSVAVGASIDKDPKTISDWNKANTFVVTSESGISQKYVVVVKINDGSKTFSSEAELNAISAAGEIKTAEIDKSNNRVLLHLKDKAALASVQLTIGVSEGASFNTITNLQVPATLTITASDGKTKKSWTISADYPMNSEADVISFKVDIPDANVVITKSNHTIVVEVPYGTDVSWVVFEASCSAGAKACIPEDDLDLSSGTVDSYVTAENGTKQVWAISSKEVKVAPKIKSIKIGEGRVAGSIDESKKTIFFNMSMSKDLKLTSLEVKSLELSEGALTTDIAIGSEYKYDFSRKKTVTVTNGETSTTYQLQAGYQYVGSDFNSWTEDANGNFYDVEGWDNGNNVATQKLTVNDEGQVVKMTTTKYSGKIASGNMLVAYFNPKNVALTTMLSYADGNELIDFGRPFYGRPEYIEFDVKYEGKSDSCDLYVLLENRTHTADDGKNVKRTSSDVNTLVASAWFRESNVDTSNDPDVVSITNASRSGFKTVRMKLKYGIPLTGSPIHNSSVFNPSLENSAGIDNHLVSTENPDNFDVTHIRIVMASSALGNMYTGVENATLWCDEVRLIY